jgi:hypothetical protein
MTRTAFSPSARPSGRKYKTDEQQADCYRSALDRIRALPGVTAAGAAQIFPLAGDAYILTFVQVGTLPLPVGNQPSAAYYAATPGYLAALRIPVKSGRDFHPRHRRGCSRPEPRR